MLSPGRDHGDVDARYEPASVPKGPPPPRRGSPRTERAMEAILAADAAEDAPEALPRSTQTGAFAPAPVSPDYAPPPRLLGS
jgi:hypothetical protein